jgi:hypothetical protein
MGPAEYCIMILLPKSSQNLPRVSLLEADFVGCSQNLNSSCYREQREGRHISPYHGRVSGCLYPGFIVVTLSFTHLSIAVSDLPWMLDHWNSCRRVFVETESSTWMFSSAVTCTAVVLWFFKKIFPNIRRSFSVNVEFHPLFSSLMSTHDSCMST